MMLKPLSSPPRISFPSLTSTNTLARKYLQHDVSNGFTISAMLQTHGKGSYDRNWLSPVGNLHCSVIINGDSITKSNSPSSTPMILTSLAVCNVLERLNLKPESIKIKWPNDILINNKKVSGILIETHSLPKAPTHFIIGIGINLLLYPKDTSYPSTSVSEHTKIINFNQILDSLQSELLTLFQDSDKSFVRLQLLYLQKLWRLNQQVSIVESNGEEFNGICRGINHNGALILENEHSKRLFYSGRILVNKKNND